jgi:dTDP-4-amino-4,6-dideoxygalactose transaminase/lipopolysaccharide/colanic/teichoic acid biosynthesis glycosyltransferase
MVSGAGRRLLPAHQSEAGPPALRYRGKRLLDLAILGVVAVPAIIAGLIIAAAVWLEDGRPVIFRQMRAGLHGHPFPLLKFRTMRPGSEHDLFPDRGSLTRVGRLLRRLSVDEIPQLLNVARGEMSVIGPRPTLPYQIERYDTRQRRRLSVLPGLTGLAQINGRNRMTWPERIEWDLRYVSNLSLRLDLAVLAGTVRTVLCDDGVWGHPHDPISQPGRRNAMSAEFPEIRLAKPDVGEEEVAAVREVLLGGTLTGGPQNAAFEQEFAAQHGAPYGVTFASGTSALAAMLMAEGIRAGDEVIVPSMTFVSTATAVRHAGATPVFADIDARSFNIDPSHIPSLVTARTRAVIAVHYAGQPAELDQLLKVCAEHGLTLLEDAAEAAGAEYRGTPVGTFGKSAMFSFTPTKNITTGEGGIVLTGDAQTADRLRLLRNHGQRRLYEHAIIGYNWRLTEMQAAIGRVQLRKLNPILARKRANAAWMGRRLAAIPGITPPYQVPHARSTHMLYTCLVDTARDALLDFLLGRGIEARVYFPPVHRQPVFAGRAYRLPVTDTVAPRMLSIPMHSLLTHSDLSRIADTLEAGMHQLGSQ